MILLCLLLCALSCQEPEAGALAARGIRLEPDRSPFGADNRVHKGEVFTLLAADADLDGDPDLIVNWHVFGPLALWRNEGGSFRWDERRWSLPEHPEVPLLDARKKDMFAAVEERTVAGIYLWHSDLRPIWWFAMKGPLANEGPPPVLVIESNRPLVAVQGLESLDHELIEGRILRVPLGQDALGGRFLLAAEEAAIQIKAHVEGADLPFFAGPALDPLSAPVDLWYRDPHGMAWVDVAGSPAPDLFVTRGALRGRLIATLDPKHEDFYLARRESDPLFERGPYERVAVPGNYARGRTVQWVDVEGDGRLELCVGSKQSPNSLLRFEPDGSLHDVAPELGLDLDGADAFLWLDLDADGDEDLVTLAAREGLMTYRNDGQRGFVRSEDLARGLRLAPVLEVPDDGEESVAGEEEARIPGIDDHDLQLLDIENDGDLDLLVSGWGPKGLCRLYLAEDGEFVDATEASGLGDLQGTMQVVVADFDADAFSDLLCLGRPPALYRNERGHMHPVALPESWEEVAEARAGTACDVDGDGRIDVVLAGLDLALARNRTESNGPWVQLTVERRGQTPIGARVLAHRLDGSTQALRVGSTHRGHLSQSNGAIPLASPLSNPLRRIEVVFPGGARREIDVAGAGAVSIRLD